MSAPCEIFLINSIRSLVYRKIRDRSGGQGIIFADLPKCIHRFSENGSWDEKKSKMTPDLKKTAYFMPIFRKKY
jgi:hypothetical protein